MVKSRAGAKRDYRRPARGRYKSRYTWAVWRGGVKVELKGVGKMKGFLEGGFWALILGGLGLSVASLANDQPVFAQGPAAPQLVAPQLTPETPNTTVSVTVTEEQAPQFLAQAPRVANPALDDVAPDVSTSPAQAPLVAEVDTALDAPTDSSAIALSSDVDNAVAAPLVSEAPQTPQVADAMDVVTPAPSVKSPEAVTEVIVIESPTAAQEPEADAPLIVILDTPASPLNELIITEDPAATDPPEVQTEAADVVVAETAVEEPQVPVATDTTPLPDTVESDEPDALGRAPTVVIIEPAPQLVPEPAPEIIVAQNEAEDAVEPQTNAPVRVNRLSVTPSEQDEVIVADATPEALAPALERYSADFENPNDLPIISIVLFDDGATDVARIADLGFAPTIAVDALAQGAQGRADAYRAAGFEVAMQVSLPEGAQPSDVEITFQSAFGIIPEAVMLFSDGTGVVQNNRSVTAQVMEILAADGRGFVTVQRGLGNAARTAQEEGVPSAIIQRDLDAGSESARAIGRGLDQAAVRARQVGGAVLLGRMQPQTLTALRDWAAGNDQETLLIAPASAVLLATSE